MKVKVSTLKNIGTLLVIIVFGVLGFILFTGDKKEITDNNEVIKIIDGKQIINLTARGGYSPSKIEAKANLETVLKVTTRNTFDCSTALIIPSLNVKENLASTGEKEIDIPPQKSGSVINGTCSMGMYGFQIKFI